MMSKLLKSRSKILALACLAVLVFASLPVLAVFGPTASFTADRTAIAVGETVSVDAHASRDSRGSTTSLQYRWDFESTYAWTSWSSSPRADHTFTVLGDKIIRLEVRDREGYTDETKLLIRVKDSTNRAPVTYFEVTPKEGDTETTFEFTAIPISQISTPGYLLAIRWDWEGDGAWDTDWSYARTFYHTFERSGSKEVWAETRDVDGSTAIEKGYWVTGKEDARDRMKEIGWVKVTKDESPRASFRTWPAEGEVGINIHFEAGASQRASEYRWDFDGDGNFDIAWQTEDKIQHAYDWAGNFQAILEVRSSSGKIDRTERTISITDLDLPPEPHFTVRNRTNSGETELGVLLDEFYFDAGSSRDRDGSVSKMQVRWDWEGDGGWDTTLSVIKTAIHRYTEVGDYQPRLEVIDEAGNSAIAMARLRIVANTPPTASLKVSPPVGTPATRFYFDASDSWDDQNRSSDLQVRFDFDGNGQFDTDFSQTKTVYRSFTAIGKKTATVEVRDKSNTLSRATINFEVKDPEKPFAFFQFSPNQTGTFATNFTFEASALGGSSGDFQYRWDFDSGGENDIIFDTGWSSREKTSHRYQTIGRHLVHLAVRNEAGELADYYQTVMIHADSEYFSYLSKKSILKEEDDPDRLITRAELAKIIAQAGGLRVTRSSLQLFVDVPIAEWYVSFIHTVVAQGWMSPRKNFYFEPNGTVNRAEAVKIIFSALYPRVVVFHENPIFKDIQRGSWYYRFANLAGAEGLVVGRHGRFGPMEKVSRAEVVRITAKLLQAYDTPSLRVASENRVTPQTLKASILELFDF